MIPVFSLDLGSADAGTDPTDSTTRKAYDLLAEGFGPGFNGPLQVVAERPRGTAADGKSALGQLQSELADDPDVASVERSAVSPERLDGGDQPFPKTSPQDQATEDLVKRIRDDIAPPVEQATGATSTSAATPRSSPTSPRPDPTSCRSSSASSSCSRRSC